MPLIQIANHSNIDRGDGKAFKCIQNDQKGFHGFSVVSEFHIKKWNVIPQTLPK
jgi:hypothetical protein